MIISGILLYGICYDFFFVTGYMYTENKAGEKIKNAAQGLFTVATYGIGMTIGSWFSGKFKCIKIPTFEELLDRYRDINLVVEIKGKQPELVSKVMEIISNNKYWKDKIYKSKTTNPKIIFCSFLQ